MAFIRDMEVTMKIITKQYKDIIVCILPNGKEVEVSMISMEGEDVCQETDLTEAARLAHQSLQMYPDNFPK